MNRSILVMTAVLSLAGTLGTTALADQKPTSQAIQEVRGTVMGHRVLSVTPHWVQESNGKRTRHLTGADVRIEAEPGMTAEYLTVELRRGLSAATAEPGTLGGVLGVAGSSVEVRSTGDGFVFRITAPDAVHAEEIVRRAQQLG
jgi:hypothetical protein